MPPGPLRKSLPARSRSRSFFRDPRGMRIFNKAVLYLQSRVGIRAWAVPTLIARSALYEFFTPIPSGLPNVNFGIVFCARYPLPFRVNQPPFFAASGGRDSSYPRRRMIPCAEKPHAPRHGRPAHNLPAAPCVCFVFLVPSRRESIYKAVPIFLA